MDSRTRSTSYVAGNRVYEDVQPQYRWAPSDKEDTLVVDLTGFKNEAEFKKEHLRIQIDNYGNLKVSGERPLAGARWSRFQRVLHLPDDCDASGIRATFDDGILLVVMPKLVRDVVHQAPPATAPTRLPAAPAAGGGTTTSLQHPPAAAPTPPPPAKESTAKGGGAASSPTQQSKLQPAPSAVPAGSAAAPAVVAPRSTSSSAPRRPPAAGPDQQKAEQVRGAPPTAHEEYRREDAAAADGKAAEPAPPPPVGPAAGKVKAPSDTLQEGKTAPGVEGDQKGTGARWSSEKTGTAAPTALGEQQVGTRPKQLLANVMVALLVLVGLGLCFFYRYKGRLQDGRPGEHHQAPASIQDD